MEYIQKKHRLDKDSSLRDRFYDALNHNEGELYGRILSLPGLHEAFQEYSQLQNVEFDWDSAISMEIKEEYARFVGTAHVWLLPSELAVIAHLFHVTVIYYPHPEAWPLTLNPGESSTVEVQFNGTNHFERLELNHEEMAVLLSSNQIPEAVYQEIAAKKGHISGGDIKSQLVTRMTSQLPSESKGLRLDEGIDYYNLACITYRERDDKLAEEYFKQALVKGSHTNLCTEYGQFLWYQKRYHEAISVLQNAILLSNSYEPAQLSYRSGEQLLLTPYLQKQLEKVEEIKMDALFIAYHLLVLSHHELKDDPARDEVLLSFAQIVIEKVQVQGYACLAYTYKCLGRNREGMSYRRQAKILETLVQVYADQEQLAASGILRITQSGILGELADCYLSRKDYRCAALLYNGALALLNSPPAKSILREEAPMDEETNLLLSESLIKKLKSIEPQFVQEQLGKEYKLLDPEAYGINLSYKKQLVELRHEVAKELKDFDAAEKMTPEEKTNWMQKIFQKISKEVKELITQMVKECMVLMGEDPPCDYAILASGSLARDEMTPYSDLEFIIAIAEVKNGDDIAKQEKIRACQRYFEKLSLFLELKIINLGETDIVKGQYFIPKIQTAAGLVMSLENPIPKGFSLDVHKKPNDPTHQLIDTPQRLARYQSQKHFIHKKEDHLSSALLSVTLVMGQKGEELYEEYLKAVHSIYQDEKIGLTRALQFLSEDSQRFEPKLDPADSGGFLNVKEDLYRLPNAILDGLALYYQLKENSTLGRIDELCYEDKETKTAFDFK